MFFFNEQSLDSGLTLLVTAWTLKGVRNRTLQTSMATLEIRALGTN